MLNTCITSTISLRTRGSRLPFSTNDYSHCSNETHPFFYSSSRPCCCCCCSSPMYKVPVIPNYCYNLYGLRQSSLIQWSPYRRLIRGDFDRCYYARLPICDVGGNCYCDRVCNFMEKSVGRRKGGFRRCMVFDERSERYNIGGVDEAEVVLSLLMGDIDEECFRVKKETRRLLKKPVVEKSENKFGGKKKRVDVSAVESEGMRENKPTYNSREKDNRRREEVIWREEEKETLLREENRKERKDALTNRTAREKEEKEALLRKPRRKADEEQERESMLRKENWKVRSRTEEREDLLRREEQRQKVRRDGSSCTSYYSFSSTGDYESEHETDLREGKFIGDSSSGHMRNSNIEIVHQNAREEYQRHGAYREDHGNSLTKKSREKEFCVGSSAVESDFRKKTEKKLTDISVEEMESIKKSSLKVSDFSTARESNYEKVFDCYSNYDDRKVKPSVSTKLDEERKQQLVQTGDEDSRQSETRLKYKQFVEMQDTHSDDVRNSYGSQKLYSGKGEMSAKVASQEKVGEIRAAVELGTREDKYERKSCEVSEVSESREIDIRKASISQQRFETSVKEEDYSTNRVSGLGESRGTSHILIKEEDKLNLAYGSSLESKQTHSQKQAKLIRRVNSRNESDEFITHSGNSGAISVDNRIKTKSETPVRPATYDFGDGSSQFDSSEVRGHNEEKSPLSHHNSSHGQPSRFSEVSESQEIDIRKASISQQRFETSVKEEDYSTNRVSGLGELRGTSHILIKEEDKLNLAYGSSLESKQTHSQKQAKLIRRVNSRNESVEFITHSGDSGAISVDNRIKTKSETSLRPATYDFGDGSSQFEFSEVRGHNEEKSPLSHHNSSHGQPSKFISQEDVIGSSARLEKSSAHYVDEFVNQVWSEISNSEIQREKKTHETKFVHEEQHPKNNLLEHSSGDPHSPEHGLKDDDQPSGSKGPPDEMWKVDEQSVQKLPKPEIQDNASKPDNAIVKRNGKSLWNIFVNIVRLRWSPRSESNSSNRNTGGRNSLNQSTSSETWVSGHEAEENEGTSITQGLSSGHQEIKTHSLVEEGSSSSTTEGYPKNVGINAPSSSVVLETSEGNFGDASSAAIVDSSIAISALRLRRFSAMRGGLETGKENPPESGVSMEQPESVVNEGEQKQKKLQRKDQVVKDRFDEWEEACRLEADQLKIDEMFMREALLEAQKGADNWEVPVGAVLVHNRKIIARGCNLVEELRDSTAHAEVICIREGSNVLRTWRLTETTLYVTLEPCPMCAGAILQARIDTVVWGAPNKLLGADGSWIRLFPSGDGGNNDLEQTDKPAAPVHPFHPKIVVRRGVLASECADAMQQFFKLRRKKDKKRETSSTPPSFLPISHRPSKFLAKMHDAFSFMFCL